MKSVAARVAGLSAERVALLQRRLAAKKKAAPLVAGPNASGGTPAPSFGQERLWLIDQLQPGNPAYNVPLVLPLRGALDVAVLRRCLDEIVRRHDVLRTSFAFKDDRLAATVTAPFPVPFQSLQLVREGEESEAAALARFCNMLTRQPFDLARDPLIRAALLRLEGEPADYRLVVTLHHIVCDAWSLRVMVEELTALYAAFAAAQPSPLPDLPVQYADFAAWQRRQLEGQARERLLGYWRNRLAGAPPTLDLPVDRPRPARSSFLGGVRTVSFAPTTIDRLKAIAVDQRCTLFMTGLALFAALLGRYAGAEDIVIGTPIAARDKPDYEKLIGFFLNTLALRIDLSGAPSFRDLLLRVRAAALEAFAHQELPFEILVLESKTDRSASVHPIFQVMFSLQNRVPGAEAAGGAPLMIDTGFSRFDLSLSLVETEDSIEGMIEYSRDLFDETTITRMAEHLRLLAEAVAAQPDRPLHGIALLTAEEQARLAAWNATAAPRDDTLCIHDLFEAQAARSPDAEALRHGARRLTYAQLNGRANRLARHLRRLGVGPERRVGLFMERSVDAIVSLLAVLKAGGAYLPLDPAYPASRLAFMVEDAEVDLVLTQSHLATQVPAAARAIAVDAAWDLLAEEPDANLPRQVQPDNLAYVIYTSGSTGLPKGVAVPHRGAVNAAEVEAALFEITPSDRILQFASLNFDASMYELLMWMRGGATLVLADADAIMPGPALLETLRAERVTVLSLPPSSLAAVPLEPVPSLRLITVMGEACPSELVARWRGVVDRIFNAYGPTETSMWVAGTDLDGARPITIGRPNANNRLYILDKHLNQVPIGVTGTLYVGGVAVTRGYLRRPGLTAERFIPDPFGETAGGRLYCTGDLARYNGDGTIAFIGRADDQVKIRGFRVELGEVEAVLHRHPAVRNAAVIAFDQPYGGRALAAYVASDDPALREADLLQFLRQSLPGHAVPSRFVLRPSLPLTESGKVARHALPALEVAVSEPEEAVLDPGTATEQTVARIWCQVLGLPHVGLDQNFFELGGHSLAAAQISARLRDALSCDVTVADVLADVTVRALAERIESGPGQRADREPSPAQAPSDAATLPEQAYPLSFAQERIWFLAQMEPGSRTYNIPTGMYLPSPVDQAALRAALDALAQRHEPLRSRFVSQGGEPVQLVGATASSPLRITDLCGLAAAECQTRIGEIAAAEMNHSFDLAQGPLLRAHLVLVEDGPACLFLTLHHIIADGWSVGLLTGEIAALYEAQRTGQPSPLPALAAQYHDFVAWQRAQLTGPEAAPLLAYWRLQLADLPLLALPHDHPRGLRRDASGAQRPLMIAAEVAEQVQRIARENSTTPFVVYLAAFTILLRLYARQDDIVVGTPMANRQRAQDEALIGLFVNPLALRMNLAGDPSFRALVERGKDVSLGALAHQDFPFERLVAELSPERIEGANPIFQVFFSYLGGNGGAVTAAAHHAVSTNKFDLSLYLMGVSNGVSGAIEYDQALFDARTIDRMVDNFLAVLDAVVADVDRPLSALPLLAAGEARQIAVWNATAVEWTDHACVHDLIEAQARKTPDLPAAMLGTASITYAELLRRSAARAEAFGRRGAGPGMRVGIHMERSLDLIVTLLAVLRTGAAYVPLDPAYPVQRLADMVSDAQLAFVVADGPAPALADCGVPIIGVAEADTPSSRSAPAAVGIEETAYLIYTSGTTGRPKGVMNAHRGLANRLSWMQQAYPIGPGDRILQKTPISFDVSVWELFWPLMTGATLVFAEPGGHRDSAYLTRLLAEQRITHVHFVPSMLSVFLDALDDTAFPHLKHVFCSGEALPREVEKRFGARLSATLHNLYGPTEAAIDVTAWHCGSQDRQGTVPIGRPIANTQIHIVDPRMEPVPIGAWGEIAIGGVQVAQGYWNRPALTASAFVPDPFAPTPGARLYRTGDIGRFRADGAIECAGRLDRQVKIRGFRIELEEIEAALAQHPRIRDAAVVAIGMGTEDAQLIAYVCPEGASAVDGDVLSSFLAKTLPAHMVPAIYVPIDSIPLAPNGKRDIKALPQPQAPERRGAVLVRPRSPVEIMLAGIWSEVLQRDDISATDNFFRLGGQSLQVMRVLARLREAAAVEITAAQFFQAPDLASLAARVVEAQSLAARDAPPLEASHDLFDRAT